MKRLVVITALACTTAACASASAPSSAPAPATESVVEVVEDVETVAESTTTSVDAETGEIIRMISLPPPSGDPELDALGVEIAGLEEELAALASAALDLEGAP